MSFYPLSDGVFTPTLVNTANITASTPYACQYLKVGDTVAFSGKVDFTTDTGGGTATQLDISLPFASNFTATEQCAGTAFTTTDKEGAIIAANVAANTASLMYNDTTANAHTMYFSIIYRILA